MRTTIDIPDPLSREVKTRAVQQGVPLKKLVTSYMSKDCEARQRLPLLRNASLFLRQYLGIRPSD